MSFITRPPYRVESERLVMRPWEPHDADAKAECLATSRDHLMPSLAWAREEPTPVPQIVDRIRRFRAQYDLGTDFMMGVFDRTDGSIVGSIGLHHRISPGAAEIGYWIDVRRTGQGYATEAAAAITRVGLTAMPYRKLEIRVLPGNDHSARIPRRLGYTYDGMIRAHVPGVLPTDAWRDSEIHSLLRTEFEASEAAARSGGVRATDARGDVLATG